MRTLSADESAEWLTVLARVLAIALAMAIAACGDDRAVGPDAGVDAAGDGVQQICVDRATYPMSIQAAAFPPSPDYPNVIVYVPQGFDASAPIDLVVFVHGFNNCITDVLGDTDIACTSGGPIRNAYHLATQLEATDKNALLVLPEVAYDQASGASGNLGTPGGFRALLEETLANIPAPLGPLALSQVGKVIVSVHSGGYSAVASMITIGDVRTDEVWLVGIRSKQRATRSRGGSSTTVRRLSCTSRSMRRVRSGCHGASSRLEAWRPVLTWEGALTRARKRKRLPKQPLMWWR